MDLDGMCQTCYDEDAYDIARFWNYHLCGSVCYLGTALGWYYDRGREECKLAA